MSVSGDKYYIGSQFSNYELDLIKTALDNMSNMKYIDIDVDETEKKRQLQYNKNCDYSVKLIDKIKGLVAKGSKTELTHELNFYKKKSEELGREKYHLGKELKELKEQKPQDEIKKVWQLHNELEKENDILRKYKYDTDKGKNPLEDELKSIKQDLENTKENLKFYQELNSENKEKIAKLENQKPEEKKPVINNVKGSIVLPLKKYHEEYDSKKYTLFLTEDQLDNINEGLRIINDADIVNPDNYPTAFNARKFINDRCIKIKANIKKKL